MRDKMVATGNEVKQATSDVSTGNTKWKHIVSIEDARESLVEGDDGKEG